MCLVIRLLVATEEMNDEHCFFLVSVSMSVRFILLHFLSHGFYAVHNYTHLID